MREPRARGYAADPSVGVAVHADAVKAPQYATTFEKRTVAADEAKLLIGRSRALKGHSLSAAVSILSKHAPIMTETRLSMIESGKITHLTRTETEALTKYAHLSPDKILLENTAENRAKLAGQF